MVSASLLPCDRSAFAPLLLRSGKNCNIAGVGIPLKWMVFNLNIITYEQKKSFLGAGVR